MADRTGGRGCAYKGMRSHAYSAYVAALPIRAPQHGKGLAWAARQLCLAQGSPPGPSAERAAPVARRTNIPRARASFPISTCESIVLERTQHQAAQPCELIFALCARQAQEQRQRGRREHAAERGCKLCVHFWRVETSSQAGLRSNCGQDALHAAVSALDVRHSASHACGEALVVARSDKPCGLTEKGRCHWPLVRDTLSHSS